MRTLNYIQAELAQRTAALYYNFFDLYMQRELESYPHVLLHPLERQKETSAILCYVSKARHGAVNTL